MRHLVYDVRYFVVPIISSLLTITLYYSVITTLVYSDTKYSAPFMTLQLNSIVLDNVGLIGVPSFFLPDISVNLPLQFLFRAL